MSVDEDSCHAPHSSSSASFIGLRKSGIVSFETTPSRTPSRTPWRFAGTSCEGNAAASNDHLLATLDGGDEVGELGFDFGHVDLHDDAPQYIDQH